MAQFRLWVKTDMVGSKCETTVEVDDADLPMDKYNYDFEKSMLNDLFDLGMLEWGFDRVDEK